MCKYVFQESPSHGLFASKSLCPGKYSSLECKYQSGTDVSAANCYCGSRLPKPRLTYHHRSSILRGRLQRLLPLVAMCLQRRLVDAVRTLTDMVPSRLWHKTEVAFADGVGLKVSKHHPRGVREWQESVPGVCCALGCLCWRYPPTSGGVPHVD